MLEIDDASSVVREVPESFDRNRVLGVPAIVAVGGFGGHIRGLAKMRTMGGSNAGGS